MEAPFNVAVDTFMDESGRGSFGRCSRINRLSKLRSWSDHSSSVKGTLRGSLLTCTVLITTVVSGGRGPEKVTRTNKPLRVTEHISMRLTRHQTPTKISRKEGREENVAGWVWYQTSKRDC